MVSFYYLLQPTFYLDVEILSQLLLKNELYFKKTLKCSYIGIFVLNGLVGLNIEKVSKL